MGMDTGMGPLRDTSQWYLPGPTQIPLGYIPPMAQNMGILPPGFQHQQAPGYFHPAMGPSAGPIYQTQIGGQEMSYILPQTLPVGSGGLHSQAPYTPARTCERGYGRFWPFGHSGRR